MPIINACFLNIMSDKFFTGNEALSFLAVNRVDTSRVFASF